MAKIGMAYTVIAYSSPVFFYCKVIHLGDTPVFPRPRNASKLQSGHIPAQGVYITLKKKLRRQFFFEAGAQPALSGCVAV